MYPGMTFSTIRWVAKHVDLPLMPGGISLHWGPSLPSCQWCLRWVRSRRSQGAQPGRNKRRQRWTAVYMSWLMTRSHGVDEFVKSMLITLPETNIAPENWWLEDYFPFGFRPIFLGELLVSGRVTSLKLCIPMCYLVICSASSCFELAATRGPNGQMWFCRC